MMFLRFRKILYLASAVLVLVAGLPTLGLAGAKIKVDDTRWFSVGAGLRASFATTEDGAPNGSESSKGVSLDGMRLYTAAKVHENITVEFNTSHDANATNDDQTIRVLDAVAKFNMPAIGGFDFWVGRFLPPSDRSNLDGPYYLNAYDYPLVSQYPGINAGRDNGIAVMKEFGGGKFKGSYGLFEGRTNGYAGTNPDQADNLLQAARLTLNLWDPEPGYYTTSSYFGAKDVLAVAFAMQSEKSGAGTQTSAGTFFGWNVDVLVEKKVQNGGVINLEYAHYNYDTDDKVDATIKQGHADLYLASYLIPNKIAWGKIQPYFRYQHFARGAGQDGGQWRTEGGFNYIINGQNAKINMMYYVDKDGTGADEKGTFRLGFQFQL